jgi:hypothetical protein
MIQDLIDKKLAEKQEKRKDRVRSGKISPSSLGKCYRYQYWNIKNEPQTNPPDARALRVFAVGHLFHKFLEDLMDCEVEVKVEDDNVLGYADIVGDDWVGDFKTVNSKKFWYLENEDKIPITERERHNFLQVTCYAMMLSKPYCKIVLISKDDFCLKEYTIGTEVLMGEVEKEINHVVSILKGDLPEGKARCYPTYRTDKKTGRMELVGHKECEYCCFRDKCKEVGNGTN